MKWLSKLCAAHLRRRGYVVEMATKAKQVRPFIAKMKVDKTDVPLIRLGPDADGGYLVPDDLDGIVASISPGVSQECRFDLDVAARGIPVYMADASVDGPPIANPQFHFSKVFLDTYESDTTTTLDTFCAAVPAEGDLLLQMDIEGAEFRVIDNMSEGLLSRFRIMVIEFHYLGALFGDLGLLTFNATFNKLLRTHRIVHIHANNCGPIHAANGVEAPNVIEVTFHRRDRAEAIGVVTEFPHPLDRTCVPSMPDIAVPRSWYA